MILGYIDPGSGSVLVQGLVGAFATLVVFFKNIKMFILSFFRKNKEQEDTIDN